MTEPKLLTVAQAAQRLGITEAALRRRIERGSLSSLMRGGRRMIPVSAVDYALDVAQSATGGSGGGERGERVADSVAPGESDSVELVRQLGKAIEVVRDETEKRVNAEHERDAAVERERSERQAREAVEAELVEVRATVVQLQAQLEGGGEAADESPAMVDAIAEQDTSAPMPAAPVAAEPRTAWWRRMLGGSPD